MLASMGAWLVLLALVFLGLAILLSGWVFQKAASWVGVEVSLGYATLVAVAAAVVQTVVQMVFAGLVLMSSPLPVLDALQQEATLLRITGGMSGIAAWLAVTMLMLDVDLWKAVAIALINMILSFVVTIALAVTLGNLLLLSVFAAFGLAGS
jgi:hypothetical protein